MSTTTSVKTLLRRVSLNPNHWVYLLIHLVLVLLGYIMYTSASGLGWKAVGTSIIATGCSGILIFSYVLLSQETAKRIRTISELGIQTGFAGRGARIRNEYDVRLSTLNQSLDVMGFGLKALRDDYREHLPKWVIRARVRILLIDPDFPQGHTYAAQREMEENNSTGSIASDVRLFVQEFRTLITSGNLHVRLYRCLPSVNIFRIDDELFWGPYLIKEQSRNSPTLLVRRDGLLFDVLVRHFDTIWSDDGLSREVPAEWLNQ